MAQCNLKSKCRVLYTLPATAQHKGSKCAVPSPGPILDLCNFFACTCSQISPLSHLRHHMPCQFHDQLGSTAVLRAAVLLRLTCCYLLILHSLCLWCHNEPGLRGRRRADALNAALVLCAYFKQESRFQAKEAGLAGMKCLASCGKPAFHMSTNCCHASHSKRSNVATLRTGTYWMSPLINVSYLPALRQLETLITTQKAVFNSEMVINSLVKRQSCYVVRLDPPQNRLLCITHPISCALTLAVKPEPQPITSHFGCTTFADPCTSIQPTCTCSPLLLGQAGCQP